jgi:starch phosphorylase
VEEAPAISVAVSSKIQVRAQVHLGSLAPEDVIVELYVGRVDTQGEIVEGIAVPMQSEGKESDGIYGYTGQTSVQHSGRHGFTIRVRPNHPDLSAPFAPSLICWANGATAGTSAGH